MKIAYIHGLESNITPNHPKVIWLNKYAHEVYAPQINYKDPTSFNKIFNYIKDFKPDVIVGSSISPTGGRFGR